MRENKKSRDLSIILLLVIALAAGAYYLLFYQPLSRSLAEAAGEREELQFEIEDLQSQIESLEGVQAEVERLKAMENPSRVYSYNNSKAELSELNNILSAARSYTISFDDVTLDGLLIRRGFNLSFDTGSYADAKDILAQLDHGEYRCLLGDLAFDHSEESTSVSVTATYFETMYGGVPDSGLPEDYFYEEAEETAE